MIFLKFQKFHQDASTLNILASEFLVWRNQKVDINKFMQFLSKKIKSQNFNEQDILRFLILNETNFFNIETKIVTTFSNTENGKIFLCLIKEDDCQNKNLLKLFKRRVSIFKFHFKFACFLIRQKQS